MDLEKFERNLETREQQSAKKNREEKRKAQRMVTFEELSLRNRRCHKRARELHDATSRSYSEETMMILGHTEKKNGHMAAKINAESRMDQYSKNRQYAVINFYFLTEEEAAGTRENPFFESTGVERVGRAVGQEKAYDMTYSPSGWREEFKDDIHSRRAGKRFNPIGAIQRYRTANKVMANLDQFEQSLDMIETAITDPQLNPALVELAQQKASQDEQAASL